MQCSADAWCRNRGKPLAYYNHLSDCGTDDVLPSSQSRNALMDFWHAWRGSVQSRKRLQPFSQTCNILIELARITWWETGRPSVYQGIKERDTLNDSIVALRDHHTTRIEDDRLYFSSTIALKGGKNICYWELMPSSAGFRRIPAESGGMCTIVQVFSLRRLRIWIPE